MMEKEGIGRPSTYAPIISTLIERNYIQKNGKYYAVRSKKALLNLLKDKKSELSSFMRRNKKRFKKNKELMIF